jgi:hypothetical protein
MGQQRKHCITLNLETPLPNSSTTVTWILSHRALQHIQLTFALQILSPLLLYPRISMLLYRILPHTLLTPRLQRHKV